MIDRFLNGFKWVLIKIIMSTEGTSDNLGDNMNNFFYGTNPMFHAKDQYAVAKA